MAVVTYRGGTQLTDETALRAHLANLLRLENVGLLLGAGASVSAGGRTIKQLWNDFVQDAPADSQWLVDERFIDASAIAAGDARVFPNVETLVDQLEVALREWLRTTDAKLARGQAVRSQLFRSVVKAAVLKEAWWTSPRGAEDDFTDLEDQRSILQKFTSARQPGQAAPWVFTTNYDLAIEWAAESIDLQVINGFLGLHGRRFSPQSFDLGFRNTQARGEARFGVYNIYLAKLHGSLTWKEESDQLFEVQASNAWEDIRSFRDGESDHLGYLVLPSAAKYIQTVGFVLGEMLRRFSEFLARPQTSLIIAGYGFGDEHINRLLRSALLNPTLQIVVYLPEFTALDATEGLPPAVKRLLSLQNPRLTIVGGGADAYLNALAKHLPEPAIYDEDLKALEMKLRGPDRDDGAGA